MGNALQGQRSLLVWHLLGHLDGRCTLLTTRSITENLYLSLQQAKYTSPTFNVSPTRNGKAIAPFIDCCKKVVAFVEAEQAEMSSCCTCGVFAFVKVPEMVFGGFGANALCR